MGLLSEGYLLRDFIKISLGPPFFTFSENAGSGSPCENCYNLMIRALLEPPFAPKSSLVFAL